MEATELCHLEVLAGALRSALADAQWERAAVIDSQLHAKLQRALAVDEVPPAAPSAETLETLQRIMRVYQGAMRDVTAARDRLGAELGAMQRGNRASRGYLDAAGS